MPFKDLKRRRFVTILATIALLSVLLMSLVRCTTPAPDAKAAMNNTTAHALVA